MVLLIQHVQIEILCNGMYMLVSIECFLTKFTTFRFYLFYGIPWYNLPPGTGKGGGGGREKSYGTDGGVGGGKQSKNVEKFHCNFFSCTKNEQK